MTPSVCTSSRLCKVGPFLPPVSKKAANRTSQVGELLIMLLLFRDLRWGRGDAVQTFACGGTHPTCFKRRNSSQLMVTVASPTRRLTAQGLRPPLIHQSTTE